MKKLASIHKYFVKHKWRLISGVFFVAISNLFAVIPPTVIRTVIDSVQQEIQNYQLLSNTSLKGDMQHYIFTQVFWYGLLLLVLALLRGVFMFFMRQTIIVI
jgi:ATP-binding cassette subfamily B protein